MPGKTSYTIKLKADEQERLIRLLRGGAYELTPKEHTRMAARGSDCTIALYNSGKCLIQGKGTEDFVLFHLEPEVTRAARMGYENTLDPTRTAPHMGIDESGKGDFFGPLVIAAAYVDEALAQSFDDMGVKDSKRITSDKKALAMARDLKKALKNRWTLVRIGPESYNRLYDKMGNVNRILAWGHARAIENLLEVIPDCPRAVADQFGPKQRIERALMQHGRKIELIQRHKAESDPAVAAASILARAGFIEALAKLGEPLDTELPKGASAKVKEVAGQLVQDRGPDILRTIAKCHFKTRQDVLAAVGL